MIVSTEQGTCANRPCPDIPVGLTEQGLGSIRGEDWLDHGLRGHDLELVVRRVTLDPGATMETVDAQWPSVRFVESGTLTWTITEAGAASPRASIDFREGEVVSYFHPEPGAVVTLENGDNEPAIYLELTVLPAGA
jgi:hypothetical protein